MICPRCDTNVREGLVAERLDESGEQTMIPRCPNCGYEGSLFLTRREEVVLGLRPPLEVVE